MLFDCGSRDLLYLPLLGSGSVLVTPIGLIERLRWLELAPEPKLGQLCTLDR